MLALCYIPHPQEKKTNQKLREVPVFISCVGTLVVALVCLPPTSLNIRQGGIIDDRKQKYKAEVAT